MSERGQQPTGPGDTPLRMEGAERCSAQLGGSLRGCWILLNSCSQNARPELVLARGRIRLGSGGSPLQDPKGMLGY